VTCKNECADRLRMSRASRVVILEVAVPSRTQESVRQNFARRRHDWSNQGQAGGNVKTFFLRHPRGIIRLGVCPAKSTRVKGLKVSE
jgi:hypothetical protein